MEQELNDHKVEIVKSLILKNFSFLAEEYFYTSVCKAEEDEIFIESFDIEYTSQLKLREISISYTKAQVYNEIRYTFSASIVRVPYKGVEDFFSLNNYLESRGKDFSTIIINDFNEREAERILLQIADALKKYALGIIEGREWLDKYYPRKD